jgi:branched-chain amino acid transport system permease protein
MGGLIRLIGAAIILALALVPLLAAVARDPFLITLATRIVIVSIAVISLQLVLGYAGLASFGHAAFFGLGAYVAGMLSRYAAQAPTGSWLNLAGTEAAIAWPAAIAVAALFGLAIGAVALRTRGIHFIMITLAFSQMLYYLFITLPSYGGDEGLRMNERQRLIGFDVIDPTAFYYVTLVALIATIGLLELLIHSRFGTVLLGCRQNERRMKFLGYPTTVYLLTAFVISAAGTGLAGALMANSVRLASPQMLSWFQSGEFMVMIILGGVTSIYGGILGAAVFLLLQEALIKFTEYWEVLLGAGLLMLVLLSPTGILGLLADRLRTHG